MPPFLESDIVLRLIAAAVLGAILGLERSIAGKHAGMRTYALVSLGSALFTVAGLIASYQYSAFVGVSPLALAGFVIVGIGFIGSGFSAMRGEGGDTHVELTTATGVWLAAGVGLAVGFGYYTIAVASTILGILIFSLFAKLEHRLRLRWSSKYTENHN